MDAVPAQGKWCAKAQNAVMLAQACLLPPALALTGSPGLIVAALSLQIESMPSSSPSSAGVGEAWIKGLTIRTRVIALLVAVLLPALCAGLWVIGLTYRLESESNERRLEETSRALSVVLDRELALRAMAMRMLANSRLLDAAPDISPPALRAFDDQARRTLTGLEGWLEVRTARRILVNTRLPPGGLPGPDDTRFATALSARTLIQPLQQDRKMGIRYATLVQPVLRDGRPVLNLALTVLPQEFQRILDRQELADGWMAAIVDSSGHVVARYPGAALHAWRLATPDLLSGIANAEQGTMSSVSLDGQPLTLLFNTSPQGWTYVTGMPQARFDGIVPPAVIKAAVAMSIVMALALAAALWVSRSIVRHVQEELEQRVEKAVAHTRRVEQRMSQLQRAEALGRLTKGLSHDFNYVLGVISNSAHLLRRKANNPDLDFAIDATLRAVDTGTGLIRNLFPPHADVPEDAAQAASTPKRTLAGSRILLVEDNEALLRTTSSLLGMYGCDLVCARSADEALRLIDQSTGFDAVLSDVKMPGTMDGIGLARHLQQKLPQLPIVLISAHQREEPVPNGVSLVHKPCSPEVLVAALEDAMSRAGP
jgi:CheY-like chemotaxis protein